jgi:hypothetical protein
VYPLYPQGVSLYTPPFWISFFSFFFFSDTKHITMRVVIFHCQGNREDFFFYFLFYFRFRRVFTFGWKWPNDLSLFFFYLLPSNPLLIKITKFSLSIYPLGLFLEGEFSPLYFLNDD